MISFVPLPDVAPKIWHLDQESHRSTSRAMTYHASRKVASLQYAQKQSQPEQGGPILCEAKSNNQDSPGQADSGQK